MRFGHPSTDRWLPAASPEGKIIGVSPSCAIRGGVTANIARRPGPAARWLYSRPRPAERSDLAVELRLNERGGNAMELRPNENRCQQTRPPRPWAYQCHRSQPPGPTPKTSGPGPSPRLPATSPKADRRPAAREASPPKSTARTRAPSPGPATPGPGQARPVSALPGTTDRTGRSSPPHTRLDRPDRLWFPPESWRTPLCGFGLGECGVLVVDRTHHADRAVPALVVVEAVAPLQHDGLCLHDGVEFIA